MWTNISGIVFLFSDVYLSVFYFGGCFSRLSEGNWHGWCFFLSSLFFLWFYSQNDNLRNNELCKITNTVMPYWLKTYDYV